MFNCIESDALMDGCRALGLESYLLNGASETYSDICIVAEGNDSLPFDMAEAFKLSDYLLATAPVDIKD